MKKAKEVKKPEKKVEKPVAKPEPKVEAKLSIIQTLERDLEIQTKAGNMVAMKEIGAELARQKRLAGLI